MRRDLIVGIHSAQHYTAHRELVRSSWFKDLKKNDIEAFFVIGTNDTNHPPIRADDCLFVACPDTRESLCLKHQLWCRYVLDKYDFDYIFKCDDDTFVHVPRLMRMSKDADYIGDNHGARCRNWFNNGMHDYAHGGSGYLLSDYATERLVDGLQQINTEILDDIIVGGIMTLNNIELVHSTRFQYLFDESLSPKPNNDIITVHYVDSLEKLKIIQANWEIK